MPNYPTSSSWAPASAASVRRKSSATPRSASRSSTSTTTTPSSRCSTRSPPTSSARPKSATRSASCCTGTRTVAFHKCAVQSVDLAKKQVVVDGMPPIDYDYLVFGLGAVVNFHGTPGAAEHSFPLYTMGDAIRLHDQILKQFEAVDKNPALVDDGALTFCIVGGGPTGTELAGAMSELLHAELAEDYPNLPVDKVRIILYEHSPHLLAPFKPKLRDYAAKTLEERGVEVHTGTGVKEVAANEITLASGEKVKTHTLIWAAGLQANPVAASLGIELAPGGRIPVGATLQLKDHPGVFAIGDVAVDDRCEDRQAAPRPRRRRPPSRPLRRQNDRQPRRRQTGRTIRLPSTKAPWPKSAAAPPSSNCPAGGTLTGPRLARLARRPPEPAERRRRKDQRLRRLGLDRAHPQTRQTHHHLRRRSRSAVGIEPCGRRLRRRLTHILRERVSPPSPPHFISYASDDQPVRHFGANLVHLSTTSNSPHHSPEPPASFPSVFPKP